MYPDVQPQDREVIPAHIREEGMNHDTNAEPLNLSFHGVIFALSRGKAMTEAKSTTSRRRVELSHSCWYTNCSGTSHISDVNDSSQNLEP